MPEVQFAPAWSVDDVDGVEITPPVVSDISDHPVLTQKIAKAVNWKTLAPMWQAPSHEKAAVSAYRKVLVDAFAKAGPKVAAFVRGRLGKLRKDAADDIPLDDIGDAAGDLADVSEDTADEVSRGALARIGVGTGNDDIVNRVSDRAVAQARARAAELVGKSWDEATQSFVDNPNPDMAITDTTREMIRGIITNGLADNLSAEDIAAQIESSTAFSPERADLVAMTEIARINSDAALTAYQDASDNGVRVKKRWIVASADVCDDCMANSKQEPIALDVAFQSGDRAPPQHPNCRCAVAPVVVDEDNSADDNGDDGDATE